MSRLVAAGIHLLVSFCIGSAIFLFVWFVLYPPPLLVSLGGHEIFLLILTVDVVLGPLLTLVVFNLAKKSLKFDLSVIVMLQLFALAYGVQTLFEARPVYIAALGEHFQVVQASSVTDGNLAKAHVSLPMMGPKLVGTKEAKELVDVIMEGDLRKVGADRGHMPQLHIPYRDMKIVVLKGSKSIDRLLDANPRKRAAILDWLEGHKLEVSRAMFQPIAIGSTSYPIVIESIGAEVVGVIPFHLTMPEK